MQIKAISSRETHRDISLDDWADLVGFDRAVADELYNRLADTGKAAIGEWELTALPNDDGSELAPKSLADDGPTYTEIRDRWALDVNYGMGKD